MASNLDRRAENLAFAFQEAITVGERLRAGRQPVSDAESFRAQIRQTLDQASVEAQRRGYNGEDIKLAVFAVVAFLDESILNLRAAVFADWPRRPLQEELFGHHVAGEIFFQNLQKIMSRDESQETADLLEVYYLCTLLGFAGKYSLSGRGDLHSIMNSTGEKIRRLRQLSPDLSPVWQLPQERIRSTGGDPWVKRLRLAALGCLVLALIVFAIYKLVLGSGVSEVERFAAFQSRS
ncbi:MAG TPA: DotU family type IV/VI secretion system protein [Bryobacteraceae bacterium]|nr:DotU family type IV/VI secretion system protein [Bryobacteraceae bacterium]